ncbi:GNAT family N-acetyltransferase [Echinicola shivajiensis]|uniref:GNAT family N-acetyltransferase n=1 Tax=Echinicola shivajiensis TaxID=1035916 RepID=UPI001BFCB603|nr:GNAT family N-acetyltransferase [Echinicola shivajiensis]
MIEEKVQISQTPHTISNSVPKIALLSGEDALNWLSNTEIKKQWNQLVKDCPWATAFQTFEFVNTWYQLYKDDYLPILILESRENLLDGFFTLALDKENTIIGAGADQAEYQVWVYHSSDCKDFLDQSLKLLWNTISPSRLWLKYLPEGSPIEDFSTNSYWLKRSHIKVHKHPILCTKSEKPYIEIKKKNKREKINRLKRQGELNFENISNHEVFTNIIDELIVQSDFRKGAVYNRLLFQEDPNRKAFILELFNQGLLHVSLFKLDQEIIASNVGVKGKGWVHLQGINTHSPFYAKHSPGIIHFLMLAQNLKEEMFEVFDLTPGADPYKSGLASEFKKAYELSIQSPSKVQLNELKNKAYNQAKSLLNKLGIDETKQRKNKAQFRFLKNKWVHLLMQNPINHIKRTYESLIYSTEYQTFVIKNKNDPDEIIEIRKNCLNDLLMYDSTHEPLPKQAFLMDCMKKLEEGQESWTFVHNHKLSVLAWFTNNLKSSKIPPAKINQSKLNGILQDFYFENGSKKNVHLFIKKLISLKHISGKDLLIHTNHKYLQQIVLNFTVPNSPIQKDRKE